METVKPLELAEVVAQIEKSSVDYRVQVVERREASWADELWPSGPAVSRARVIEREGQREVDEWPIDPEVRALLDRGEEHFKAKRWLEARDGYLAAAHRAPDCYLALLYAGDAEMFAGQPAEALKRHVQAADINPFDYRVYLFQAAALKHLRRWDEMREALSRVLTLRPRFPSVVDALGSSELPAGMNVSVDPLRPAVTLLREDAAIRLQVSPDGGAHWSGYGMGKALWMGERRQQMGKRPDQWSPDEEVECLRILAAGYERGLAAGKAAREPALDRLVQAVAADLLDAYVTYEVHSRMDPNVVLRLPAPQREAVDRYVRSLVIWPASG